MSMIFATDVIVNNGYKFNNGRIFSGTSDTAAATTTKAVTCSLFKSTDLVKGAAVFVTFTYTNSGAVGSLKMNVNSTGDKPVKCLINGALANLPAVGYLLANETYLFMYDGTNWVTTVNRDNDSNTTTFISYASAQSLTEAQQKQAYANLGFPDATMGKLGYTVVT